MKLEVNPEHPEPRKIERAAQILKDGGLVAMPTDTVYGLVAEFGNKKAMDRLYAMKGIEAEHPLAILCADLSEIAHYAVVPDRAFRMMKRLIPGPYVFVLQASREVPKELHMKKKKTVGLRVPDHPVALALLQNMGKPLLTTSATKDKAALWDVDEIEEIYPGLDMILDAGSGGVDPSTVIDMTGDDPVLIREGKGSENV